MKFFDGVKNALAVEAAAALVVLAGLRIAGVI